MMWIKRNFIVAVALQLAACSDAVPPLVRDPIKVLSMPDQFASSQTTPTELTKSLLDLFNEPVLTTAIERALDRNFDIQSAILTMEQAGFLAGISQSGQRPTVTGSVSNSRTGDSNPIQNSANLSLDVRWELDLWGKLRDGHDASRSDAMAAAEQLGFVRASIAAQVMQGWFEFSRASKAVQLESDRLEGLKRREGLVRNNYLAGVANFDDLAAIERDVALSESVRLANIGIRNDAARALELLMGEYPDGNLVEKPILPMLRNAPKAGIPASVIAQRPDLRAAWQRVVAADKRVNVAQKDLLPSITLTGSLGSSSQDFGNLLNGATVWSLVGNLTAPIFDSGRRRTEVLSSRNRADQAWVAYLQLVLRAFSEVESALDRETILRKREVELGAALRHALTTAEIFETRYQAGLVSILEVLTTQSAVFDIRVQLLSVRTARLNNRVALALALGKGV